MKKREVYADFIENLVSVDFGSSLEELDCK